MIKRGEGSLKDIKKGEKLGKMLDSQGVEIDEGGNMCKELNDELAIGKFIALKLVKHQENMGAAQCDITVESKGINYIVSIKQIENYGPVAQVERQNRTFKAKS